MVSPTNVDVNPATGMSIPSAKDGELFQYSTVKALQQDMLKLLESGNQSDICLSIRGTETSFRVHSSIFSVRCRNLREQVLKFLEEKRDNIRPDDDTLFVSLRPFSIQAVSAVLRYIYSGKITLTNENVYDICCMSSTFGIPSLQGIVLTYLNDDENIGLLAPVLDKALYDSQQDADLVTLLTERFSEDCSKILQHTDTRTLSAKFMLHLVKQENLNASEYDVWRTLVVWACFKCNIPTERRVSDMSDDERNQVSQEISTFCRPAYLRILNFETEEFAGEVEPLKVFPSSEVLLKYRFDATVGVVSFDLAFPKDRYDFLSRVRHRIITFESAHPHARGVVSEEKVDMPLWVNEMEVRFDQRTEIGRYAELAFFYDSDKQNRIFSSRYDRDSNSRRSPNMSNASEAQTKLHLDPFRVKGNCFWFTFYSPQNVGTLAWGFKFQVSITSSLGY